MFSLGIFDSLEELMALRERFSMLSGNDRMSALDLGRSDSPENRVLVEEIYPNVTSCIGAVYTWYCSSVFLVLDGQCWMDSIGWTVLDGQYFTREK